MSGPIGFSTPGILAAAAAIDNPVSTDMELATVDPAFTGTGNPKVTFDKEASLSQKTYPYLGVTPGAGDRVLMQPIGGGWVISGALGGSTSVPKDIRFYQEQKEATVSTPFTVPTGKYTLCQLTVPDPGWPYLLGACACSYYTANDNADSITQWDMVCMVDNATTGVAISKYGVGIVDSGRQTYAGWHLGATVYTGAHTVYQILTRSAGASGLFAVQGFAYTGMTVIQVPT